MSLMAIATANFADNPEVKTPPAVAFEKHIKPIFQKHCIECHSGWFPAAGLRLDSVDAILKGGNSGPAVVPGSPDKGWLMYSLSGKENQGMQMPPDGKKLSAEQIRIIAEWIARGAM